MPQPRLLHDMLILPTGQILIINGAKHGCAGFDNARNASLEPYPPKRYLGKGSTLLPDGRVLVGGGNPHPRYIFRNVAYPTELRLQAFVPHYMDKRYHNKRPMNLTIEYGNQIGYGKEFRVKFMVVKKGQISNNTVTFSECNFGSTTIIFCCTFWLLLAHCC
ncbi:aldehyde oxidase GLOX1-like isoform X2 [Arachis ipaensis]|nr:aldehyde oxidase GLOX1-like isoform X2 [Arachis ipaensis]